MAFVKVTDENTAIRGPLKVRESGRESRWKDRLEARVKMNELPETRPAGSAGAPHAPQCGGR